MKSRIYSILNKGLFKKTHKTSHQIMRATAVITFASASQAQAAIILSNDFGAGADTGPAFGLMSNGVEENDLSNAAAGLISFQDVAGGGTPTVGFSTVSALNVSGDAGFTLTWVVNTASVSTIDANGWFFGVQKTQGLPDVGATLWNSTANQAFGIVLGRTQSGHDRSPELAGNDLGTRTLTSWATAVPTYASLNDGFTISMTVNSDDSWSASSTGLSSDFSETGAALPGTVTYADLASSLYVSTTLQSLGQTQQIANYGSVTLDTVPEPSSALLVGLSGMMLTLRRRRRN